MEASIIREAVIEFEIWIFILIMLVLCFVSYCDPSKFRASTTLLKYFSGYMLYASIGIALCLFMAAFPDLVISTLSDSGAPEDSLAVSIFGSWAEILPSFAALLLMLILIRHMPPVQRWHANLLTWIRTLVNIPVEQGLLALQLKNGKYDLFLEDQTAKAIRMDEADEDTASADTLSGLVEGVLEEDGIDRRDWIFESTQSLRFQWMKTISLFIRFETAFSDVRYRRYARLFPQQLDSRRERFRVLREKVTPVIQRIREFLDDPKTPRVEPGTMEELQLIRERFGKEVRDLRQKDLDRFQRRLLEDFAGIIHCCATTAVQRRRLLSRFGFEHVPGFRDIAAPLTISFIFLLIIVLGVFPLVAPASITSVEGMIRIFVSMFSAVLISLIIIESPLANLDDAADDHSDIYHADWERVVTPSTIALVLGIGIGIGLTLHYSIAHWLPVEFRSSTGFCYKEPLALIPGVSAAVLTYLMLQRTLPVNRLLDAGILAGSLVATIFVLIYNIMPMVNATCPGSPEVPPKMAVVVMSLLIGLFIGATIPDWARKKRLQIDKVREQDSNLDTDEMETA